MRSRRHPAVFAAAAALALSAVLTGCGSDGDGGAAPASESAKKDGSAPVPSPDADQTRKLIDAVKAVDPELATPEKRAVQGAMVTCEALANGVPRQTVVDTAASNFGGAVEGAPRMDKAEADKLVSAVESSFCKV